MILGRYAEIEIAAVGKHLSYKIMEQRGEQVQLAATRCGRYILRMGHDARVVHADAGARLAID